MTARARRGMAAAAVLALLVGIAPAAASAGSSGFSLRPAVASEPDPSPNVFLRGRGWGHSVGLSQYGAWSQSRAGRSAAQILGHYYPGTQIESYTGDQRVTVQLSHVLTPAAPAAPTNGILATNAEAIDGAVSWHACPAAGGGCDGPLVQPAGTTWHVRLNGDLDVELWDVPVTADRTDLEPVATSDGSLQARLTDRDVPAPAGAILRTFNATNATSNGTAEQRRHAYGWILYDVERTRLRVRNQLPLESYLRGIAEVPSSWGTPTNGGQAALNAQAIIARSYVLSRNRSICSTPACQVFNGYEKEIHPNEAPFAAYWVAAVTGTAGQMLRYNGQIASTFYSSSHGGRTESSADSWAYGNAVPYLPSVDDPWSLDAINPMRSWSAVVPNSEFHRVVGGGLGRIERVTILSRTPGGSPSELLVAGPGGSRTFTTTPVAQRQPRGCNRIHAGNSLRCDLVGATVRNAAGDLFAGAGNQPPSSQITSIGFAPFLDDDGNAHEYAIVWANNAGIAQGTTTTTYRPRAAVNRGQMASFIYRTFQVPTVTSHDFPDVAPGNEHATAIASLAAAGVIEGFANGTYGPTAPVTRAQVATMLTRAMGLDPTPAPFSDVTPGSTHAGAIGALHATGITQGCATNSYCPQDPVLRDQMASLLHRTARHLR